MIFDRELTGGEEVTLENVLNNHVPEILYSQYFCPYSSDTNIVSAEYKSVVSFNFPIQLGIKKIEVVANIPGTATSYDLRVLDITHNNILFTGNYTNINSQILVLSSLSNIPLSSSFISVQVKVNGGDKTVLINNISVFM
jgi:hypothetical protein